MSDARRNLAELPRNSKEMPLEASDALTPVHTLRLGGCSTGWGLNRRAFRVDSMRGRIVSYAECRGRLVSDVQHSGRMLPPDGRVRVVAEGVSPESECGTPLAQRIIENFLTVEADISTDGTSRGAI